MVKITDPYLKQLKEKVLARMGNEKVRIFIFGSRARGDHHSTSDVDIGFIPQGKWDKRKMTLLKEEIENLNIPYKVELVDFSEAWESFKEQAACDMILWKD